MSRDLRCLEDLDPFGAECADPLEELIQDLYHRLLETPGSNLDDPDRGLGLEDALGGPVDNGLAFRINHEFEKDARITSCQATVDTVTNGNAAASTTITIILDIDSDQLNLEGYKMIVIKDENGIHLQRST